MSYANTSEEVIGILIKELYYSVIDEIEDNISDIHKVTDGCIKLDATEI